MNIVIGSVLKPLDDVRHFLKIGRSVLQNTRHSIFIFARDVPYKIGSNSSNLVMQPIAPMRISLKARLIAPFIFFIKLIKVKPSIIIVCTHELLLVSILYKILFPSKIVYDVQENYKKNIECNLVYNPFVKPILSYWVRLKEKICANFIDTFWLAEECYLQELSFLDKDKTYVIDNKSLQFKKVEKVNFQNKKVITLLFSGTIAPETGVWKAIELVKALNAIDKKFRLLIAGCCHQTNTFSQLLQVARDTSYIDLKISEWPISYEDIVECISKADIGLVCYNSQANLNSKIPTKLYEYLTLGLPILLTNNILWINYCSPFKCAIIIDEFKQDANKIYSDIINSVFYPKSNDTSKQFCWVHNEKTLLHSIQKILAC